MKRNNEWYPVINGTEHEITADNIKGSYVISVDGEIITEKDIPNNRVLNREGMEVPFEVDGVECRFIIWNHLPDLSVDGILMSCDKPYKEIRRQLAINMLSQCLSSALVGFLVLIIVTIGFIMKKLTVYTFVPVLIPCAIFLIRALSFYIKYKCFVNAGKVTKNEK